MAEIGEKFVSGLLDGFSPAVSLGSVDWSCVPESAGVYVVFDSSHKRPIYVGMAGRTARDPVTSQSPIRPYYAPAIRPFVIQTTFRAIAPLTELPRRTCDRV